jgi:hypothetical protein
MRGLALTVSSGMLCSEGYRSVTRAGATCGWAKELPTLPPGLARRSTGRPRETVPRGPRGAQRSQPPGPSSDFDLWWIEEG